MAMSSVNLYKWLIITNFVVLNYINTTYLIPVYVELFIAKFFQTDVNNNIK